MLHKGNIVLRISILLHKNKNKKVKWIHVNNATHTYNFVLCRSITYHQNESKQENSFYILTITTIVTSNKLHHHSYFDWIMNYISWKMHHELDVLLFQPQHQRQLSCSSTIEVRNCTDFFLSQHLKYTNTQNINGVSSPFSSKNKHL